MPRVHQTLLAMCALLSTAAGCASEGVGCTAASYSFFLYQAKSDFDGRWEQVSTLAEIDGELPLTIGAESTPRVV